MFTRPDSGFLFTIRYGKWAQEVHPTQSGITEINLLAPLRASDELPVASTARDKNLGIATQSQRKSLPPFAPHSFLLRCADTLRHCVWVLASSWVLPSFLLPSRTSQACLRSSTPLHARNVTSPSSKHRPLEAGLAFYRNIVDNDLCHFVALLDGVVVGWCDVLPTHGEARAHVGTLGMGLVAKARHIGIGAKLMDATLSKAWRKGFSRIELTVRTDNANAKALYERVGFTVEGLNRNAFFVDGKFYDTYSMALLRPHGVQV